MDESQHGHPKATQRVIWLSLVFVAIGAGTASYLDALTVMQATIPQAAVAYIVASLADPVILATSADLRDAYRHDAPRPRWSVASLGVAIGMTIYLNVMAAYPHQVPPWLVRAWVPVAFLLTLESLMSYTRRGRAGDPVVSRTGPAATINGESHRAATTPELAAAALDENIRALSASMSERDVARTLKIGRPRVAAATASNGNGSHPEGP